MHNPTQILKDVFGRFASGVTVITARHGEEVHGMTASAVSSLSADPPLLMVAVDHRATMCDFLKKSGAFAVNVLLRSQEPLSNRFAARGPKEMSDIPMGDSVTGSPVFAESLAYAECKIRHILPGGDHDIFVGEIVAGRGGEGEPLVYFKGKYRSLTDFS